MSRNQPVRSKAQSIESIQHDSGFEGTAQPLDSVDRTSGESSPLEASAVPLETSQIATSDRVVRADVALVEIKDILRKIVEEIHNISLMEETKCQSIASQAEGINAQLPVLSQAVQQIASGIERLAGISSQNNAVPAEKIDASSQLSQVSNTDSTQWAATMAELLARVGAVEEKVTKLESQSQASPYSQNETDAGEADGERVYPPSGMAMSENVSLDFLASLPPLFHKGGLLFGTAGLLEQQVKRGSATAIELHKLLSDWVTILSSSEPSIPAVGKLVHDISRSAYQYWRSINVDETTWSVEWCDAFNRFLRDSELPLSVQFIMPKSPVDYHRMQIVSSIEDRRMLVKEVLSWIVWDNSGHDPKMMHSGMVITC